MLLWRKGDAPCGYLGVRRGSIPLPGYDRIFCQKADGMNFFRQLHNAWDRVAQSAHFYGDGEGPRSRRSIICSGLAYNIVFNILNGSYLAGFCLTIGASANQVNAIVIVLSVCNLVQIISPLFMARLRRRKPLLIALRGTAHAVNILVIPALALAGIPGNVLLPLVTVLLGMAQCLLAFVSPGIQVWHIGCIPPEKQLGHFSFFTVMNCITVYVGLFLWGLVTDGLSGWLGKGIALPLVRMSMLLLAAIDIFFLTRIHEYPPEESRRQSVWKFFAQMGRCIRESPAYCKIIGVASAWNLVANIPSQYYNTYLLENLGLSYTFLNSVTLFNVVVVLALTPVWKRFVQWKGVRGCLFWSVLLFAPHAVGYAFTTAETVFLYPISVIYNLIFAAGINLGFSLVPYLNLPEKNRTIYMAVYNTSCALSALLGVLFGRLVFTLLEAAGTVRLFGAEVTPAQILVAVFAFALGGAAFLFRHLLKDCGA